MIKKLFLINIIFILLIVNSWAGSVTSGPQIQSNTSTYDAFGFLQSVDLDGDGSPDKVHNIFRQGDTHNLADDEGFIVMETFDIDSESWGTRSTVSQIPDENCGDAHGGVLRDKIYAFYYCCADSAPTLCVIEGLYYSVSTDLTGSSWGERQFVSLVANEWHIPFGKIVGTATNGKYYLPFQHRIPPSGNFNTSLIVTTNSGATWSLGPNMTTLDQWTEPAVEHIGNDKFIMHARYGTGSGLYMGQATSPDGGDTWSAVTQATNLGDDTQGIKVPWLHYDSSIEKIYALYDDRTPSINAVELSVSDPSTVFNDSTKWNGPVTLATSVWPGYPSMAKISNDPVKYLMVYTAQTTDTDSDIYWLIYEDMALGSGLTIEGLTFD